MTTRSPRVSAGLLFATAPTLLVCACVSSTPSTSKNTTDATITETRRLVGVDLRIETEPEDDVVSETEVSRRLEVYKNTVTYEESTLPITGAADAGLREAMVLRPSLMYDPFIVRKCPPEGSAMSLAKQKKNRLKNRAAPPKPSDIDSRVTLSELRRPGDDKHRWLESSGATIEGFVVGVFGTGAESCNCGTKSKKLTDTHIDVIAYAGDTERKVVVEITPVLRLLHSHYGLQDWSSANLEGLLKGKQVRFTGWLFYDDIHETGADNTDPENDDGEDNWRATAWEIHPVTSFTVIN